MSNQTSSERRNDEGSFSPPGGINTGNLHDEEQKKIDYMEFRAEDLQQEELGGEERSGWALHHAMRKATPPQNKKQAHQNIDL
jgi:hypothetical protein